MDILKAPKGTRDLAGREAEAFTRLEETARRVFTLHGFSEVRTPLFESADLFSRSLGETSDVVEKEMFTFTDRGERAYALRPDGTAGVVRYFIENSLAVQGGPHRLYYSGPMFRAERPQAGRYRQFWQIGSENLGSPDPVSDADTVTMAAELLRDYGVPRFSIHVNSLGCKSCRAQHRASLLSYLKSKESQLSEESRRRMTLNPLRVLDSKADGAKLTDAPAMKNFLCADCAKHHATFLNLVRRDSLQIEENDRLVRGLDYYTRTVFEFVSPDLGAQSALAAGGRYDELVEMLGGPATPAVGFAMGVDRVVSVCLSQNTLPALTPSKKAFVIPMMEEALPIAFSLAEKLRAGGVMVPSPSHVKKLKNQLSQAVDFGANWAILIGEDELKSKEVTLKNLATREQTRLAAEEILNVIRK